VTLEPKPDVRIEISGLQKRDMSEVSPFTGPIPILHVMTRLPVGGVENQLLLVLKHYDKAKLSPTVCSLSDKGETGKKIEDLGIEVICLNKLEHGFDWTIVRDLMNIMKDRNAGVVRTHQYHANLYGRLAAWLCKVPCIVPSIHNVYTRDRKIHRRILNNLLGRISDKIVAVSEAVKADIVAYDKVPDSRVKVIYNGVEEVKFTRAEGISARSEFNIPEHAKVIGTVGRLALQKGQRYLIESVASLVKEFPEIILLIVGDGPEKAALKRTVSEKGIDRQVIFTGTRDDVPDLLAAMDIFVFPSLREGLGNALVEAMAAGKAIVATDIPPVREVIASQDNGILVPPGDSGALEAAITSLLRDKRSAEAYGAAAKERALSYFDINSTINSYTNLFESILAGKASYPGGSRKYMC